MAKKLLGPVNSVPVNSTYPVNGSLLIERILPGLGSGDKICIPFEDRHSEIPATELIIIAAENRHSEILPENRHTEIGPRDKCT